MSWGVGVLARVSIHIGRMSLAYIGVSINGYKMWPLKIPTFAIPRLPKILGFWY
jgi:hypothetical protein